MYDGEQEIFRGTANEIKKAFDDDISCKDQIYTYERTGHRLYGRYTFKDAGLRFVPNEKKEKPKKVTKHDRELEYLAMHLRIYGNVFFHKRADNYKKELEDLGIQFKTRKCVMFNDGFILERI